MKHKIHIQFLIAIITITAYVTRVVDGDTLYCRSNGITYTIRLYGIDAPEKKTAAGKKSYEQLKKLISNKTVKIEPMGNGKYGRMIAKVYLKDKYINLEMIKSGHAKWFEKYAPDDKQLKEAQENASKETRQ